MPDYTAVSFLNQELKHTDILLEIKGNHYVWAYKKFFTNLRPINAYYSGSYINIGHE